MTEDCATAEAELNRLIALGRFEEGFERFYDDDVLIQQTSGEETRGKDANRAREAKFHARVTSMKATLFGGAVQGDRAFSEWRYEIGLATGEGRELCQVA